MAVCKKLWFNAELDLAGQFQPCNSFDGIIKHLAYDLDSYHSSPDLTRIINDHQQGVQNTECAVCWHNEKFGFRSQRQLAQEQLPAISDSPQLTVLDYSFDHLCTLKCVMCNETASSAVAAEKLAMGQKIQLVKKNQSSQRLDFLAKHLPSLSELKIYNGGEPLISPLFEPAVALINRLNPRVNLMINTGGTRISDKVIELLKQIQCLTVKFSIDSHGTANDFIRYPSLWADIEHNIQLLKTLPQAKIFVHITVQPLGLYRLDQLINWCQLHELDYQMAPIIRVPWLDTRIVPPAARPILKSKIKQILRGINFNQQPGKARTLLATLNQLEHIEFCEKTHSQLVHELDLRCNLRKINLVDYLPYETELLELRNYDK